MLLVLLLVMFPQVEGDRRRSDLRKKRHTNIRTTARIEGEKLEADD